MSGEKVSNDKRKQQSAVPQWQERWVIPWMLELRKHGLS